jgi:hypothetical protein
MFNRTFLLVCCILSASGCGTQFLDVKSIVAKKSNRTDVEKWAKSTRLTPYSLANLAISRGIGETDMEGYLKKTNNRSDLIVISYSGEVVTGLSRVSDFPHQTSPSRDWKWEYFSSVDQKFEFSR